MENAVPPRHYKALTAQVARGYSDGSWRYGTRPPAQKAPWAALLLRLAALATVQ